MQLLSYKLNPTIKYFVYLWLLLKKSLAEQVLLLETVKQFLKYSYPGLRSFKTSFCKASTRYRPK